MEVTHREAQQLNDKIAERLLYIAKLNPRGVNKLASKYGYPVPKENINSKFNFLTLFFTENGEDDRAIDELLVAHPDFALFAETMATKMSKLKPSFEPEQHDGYFDIEDFGNYDGFVDSIHTYNNDAFVGGIISAVGDLGAAGINKIGAGKERKTAEKIAGESTKQAQTSVDVAQKQLEMSQKSVDIAKIQSKAAKKEATEKRKTYMYISLAVVALIILAVGGYIIYKRMKK